MNQSTMMMSETLGAPTSRRWSLPRLRIEPVDERHAGPGGTASLDYFQKRVDEEMQTARATGEALCCVAIRITGSDPDVTGLEPIHAAKLVGDFARFLTEVTPAETTICSQGAGTFALLTPRTTGAQGLRLAHRLLWEIHDRAWKIANCYVDLMCSIGLAEMAGPADRLVVNRAIDAVNRAAGRGEPLSVATAMSH